MALPWGSSAAGVGASLGQEGQLDCRAGEEPLGSPWRRLTGHLLLLPALKQLGHRRGWHSGGAAEKVPSMVGAWKLEGVLLGREPAESGMA